MCQRFGRNILLILFLGLFSPKGLSAQIRPTAGGWVGVSSSRQLRDDGLNTDWVSGPTFGAYLDTATPISILFVRVGLGYHRRGSEVSGPGAGTSDPSPARVTSDYVGIQLHGRLKLTVGALDLFLFGGPIMDLLVKTGCTEEFCTSLGEGNPTVWGVAGGGGAEVGIPAGGRATLEYRWEEGLSVAYQNDLAEARNRSRSLILSVGFPFISGSP
jgi:hypothetical protein